MEETINQMRAEIISNLGYSLSSEAKLWCIILFLFILVLALIIVLQWRIIRDRENREALDNLKATLDLGIRNFIEDGSQREFSKRLNYLRSCMLIYRQNNLEEK